MAHPIGPGARPRGAGADDPDVSVHAAGGHVADNYNRKRIVVLMTAAIAAASLGVAFISWHHAPVIWIYFCLFTGSTANTFMRAANAAFLPALVAREDFPRAVELERRRLPALLHHRPGGRRRAYRLDGLALFQPSQ